MKNAENSNRRYDYYSSKIYSESEPPSPDLLVKNSCDFVEKLIGYTIEEVIMRLCMNQNKFMYEGNVRSKYGQSARLVPHKYFHG